MVYIDRDGRVLQRRPWNLSRIVSIFMSLWFMAVTFFWTLSSPFMSDRNRSQGNERRRRWGGGGGGGPGGDGNGGSGPSNRRIGRINRSEVMSCPTGGCGCG